MKVFQYITILLFVLASVLFGLRGYGQTFPEVNRHQWPLTPGYEAQDKYDTVKIRMLVDLGGNVPAHINGYVVRRWYVYYPGVDPGSCYGCPPPPPDKWVDTEDLLGDNKFNTVDKRKIWQYKYFNWYK